MGWQVKVWNATRTRVIGEFTHLNAFQFNGGFTWDRDPARMGDGVKFDFSVRNDQAKIEPRAVAQVIIDGAAQFFGVIVDPPSQFSSVYETVTILGGREALTVCEMDATAYTKTGAYTIIRDILSRLTPPALLFDPKLIGDDGTGTDAGQVVERYFAPYRPLLNVLDDIAAAAGATVFVTPEGFIRVCKPLADTMTVEYDSQEWRRLRVQGRETVTKANVIIVSGASSNATPTTNFFRRGETDAFLPKPVSVSAEDPEHATYGATRTFAAPPGVALTKLIPPSIPNGAAEFVTNPNAAIDDSPDTYAQPNGAQMWRLGFFMSRYTHPDVKNIFGVQLTYSLTGGDDAVDAYLTTNGDLSTWGSFRQFTVTNSVLSPSEDRRVVTWILPQDARAPDWYSFSFNLSARRLNQPGLNLRVFDVRFITVDEAAAMNYAKTLLHPPYATPAEIVLNGIHPPARMIEVRNSPDGTLRGQAASITYEYTRESGAKTRVKIGATGDSDLTRAIQWTVRNGV